MMPRTARSVILFAVALGVLAGCAEPPPAIPAGISDEQAMELSLTRYEYDLGLLLEEFPGAVVPEAHIQSMVPSRADWSLMQVMCLVGFGIRGVEPTLGGYAIRGDNDPQAEAVAQLACRYEYPIDPRILGALSPEQAGYAWDYLVERVVPCMRTLGFEASPPAGRDEFVTYSARVWGSSLWSPYGRFEDPFFGPERILVDQHCPPLPDDPFAVFNGTLSQRINGQQ